MWDHSALEAARVRMVVEEQAEAEQAKLAFGRRDHDSTGDAQTRAFIAGVTGNPLGPVGLAGAMVAMQLQDAQEARVRSSAHTLVDSWLWNQGGTLGQLRDLLGTRQHAVRAEMGRQQQDLHGRVRAAEARRSELERLCERQGNEITWLRSRLDRLEAVVGGQGR